MLYFTAPRRLKCFITGLVLAWQATTSPVTLASHSKELVQFPADLFPVQLSVHVSIEAADDAPKAWVHATHVGSQEGIPGFCFGLAPDTAIWGGNQGMEGPFLFPCFSKK